MTTKTAPRYDVSFYPQDGYTLDGYIAAIPGLTSRPLRFKFRPLPHLDYAEIEDGLGRMSPNAHQRRCASMMAARIVEWDQLDHEGNPVEVTPENVIRLGTRRFRQLFMIVVGVTPSDEDPQWSDPKKAEAAQIEWESVEAETTVGQHREEADAKNS